MAEPEKELELPDGMEALSLDKLSQSFARLFGPAEEHEAQESDAPDESTLAEDLSVRLSPASEPAEEPYEVTPRRLFEAMLFVGSPENESLSAARAASIMRGVEEAEIHELVQELNAQYAADHCPYRIVSEGAGYRLTLVEQYWALRDKFHGRLRQVRLSQAAIDVLAIVAYHQPLTADEVTQLRHTPSGPLLNQLVRRKLLRIDRGDEKPRKIRYSTTDRFLELFGLASLEDLPQSHDLE